MANDTDIDAVWSDISILKIRFDETVQKMQLYANGRMQLKVVVEILAKNENGDPVSLSENQLLLLKLVDADVADSEDPGNGWSFSSMENEFNHRLSSASGYYSASGDNEDSTSDSNIQTRILWVSSTKVSTKKIGVKIQSPTSHNMFSSTKISESAILCEAINTINYTPTSLKCEKENKASGTYKDYSILVFNVFGLDNEEYESFKKWHHENIYIKPASGLRFVAATYHFKAENGTEQDLNQDSVMLLTPTGGWNGDKPETHKDVYERETNGKFPLIPLKYDQNNNNLHVFDLWYFLAPEAFRNDWELPNGFISTYDGPVTVGAEVSYRRPRGAEQDFGTTGREAKVDSEWRDHRLYTTEKITGNGQPGAICISHVCFEHTNSSQAYEDINYLRDNNIWIDFLDEYGNKGAIGLLIDDDEVKLTSHLLT